LKGAVPSEFLRERGTVTLPKRRRKQILFESKFLAVQGLAASASATATATATDWLFEIVCEQDENTNVSRSHGDYTFVCVVNHN